MPNKDYLNDIRVVKRYISEGKLTEKDHQKFIKDLDDVSEKAEKLIIEEEISSEENTEETDNDDDE